MVIEFEYFLDGEKGTTTLTVLKGELNALQKEVLAKEIMEQQTALINQFLNNPNTPQHFRPRASIHGLPEDISFRYTSKTSHRSVTFKMFWEEVPASLFKMLPQGAKEEELPFDDAPSKTKIHGMTSQQDWVLFFIEDLDQCLNTLLPPSLDSAERAAINYAVAELQKSLTSNSKNSTLLLFSAYLQSTITHFLQVDKDKAHFFRLAARALETKTDIETAQQACCDESLNKNLFTKILQQFFPTKGS